MEVWSWFQGKVGYRNTQVLRWLQGESVFSYVMNPQNVWKTETRIEHKRQNFLPSNSRCVSIFWSHSIQAVPYMMFTEKKSRFSRKEEMAMHTNITEVFKHKRAIFQFPAPQSYSGIPSVFHRL